MTSASGASRPAAPVRRPGRDGGRARRGEPTHPARDHRSDGDRDRPSTAHHGPRPGRRRARTTRSPAPGVTARPLTARAVTAALRPAVAVRTPAALGGPGTVTRPTGLAVTLSAGGLVFSHRKAPSVSWCDGPAAWSILARAGGGAPTGPLEGPGNTETPHPGVPGGASRQQFVRRRPTLPHRSQCSTIGAEGLSFRVRNGAGRFPFAMTAVTPGRHGVVFPETGYNQ